MKSGSFLMTVAILIMAMTSFAQVTGKITDSHDGKIYTTVTIGAQTWMAENLAFKSETGCWAYNNDQSNVKTYGYLYNWDVANNVCPAGWHLPSDTEWTILTKHLGDEKEVGGKLKSTSIWKSPNTGATNSSGFSALPGGSRYIDKSFKGLGDYGYWWSSTVSYQGEAWSREIYFYYGTIIGEDYDFKSGLSVRCIKDK